MHRFLPVLSFCVPLISGAEESLPEGAQVVQTQSDAQSGTQPNPMKVPRQSSKKSWLPPRSFPHRQKSFPFPCKSFQEKRSKSRAPMICRKSSLNIFPSISRNTPGLFHRSASGDFRSDTTGTDIKGHVLVLIDGHRAGTGNIAEIPAGKCGTNRNRARPGVRRLWIGSHGRGRKYHYAQRAGDPLRKRGGRVLEAGIIPKGTQVFRAVSWTTGLESRSPGEPSRKAATTREEEPKFPIPATTIRLIRRAFLQPQAPITPFLPLGTSIKPGAWELRIPPIWRLIL